MTEKIENVEVNVAEENENATVVTVEKKEGFVKKAGNWIKTNAPKAGKVLALGVAVGAGFLLGAHSAGKSNDVNSDIEDSDVIDADDYVVLEDAE